MAERSIILLAPAPYSPHYWAWAIADIDAKIEQQHSAWKETAKREEAARQKRILDAMVVFPRTCILQKLDAEAARIIKKHDVDN